MKAVMISIQPKWVEKIAKGEKTIEVRKSRPKIDTPFKCYIYCTKDNKTAFNNRNGNMFLSPKGWQDYSECNGKVIGEFVCDKIYDLFPFSMGTGIELFDAPISLEKFCKESCLTEQEICDYIGEKDGYGWHISDLHIYDKPKELSEFKKTKERIARTCGMQARNGLCCAIDHEELCDNVKCCFKTPCPPQSWQYVEELENANFNI